MSPGKLILAIWISTVLPLLPAAGAAEPKGAGAGRSPTAADVIRSLARMAGEGKVVSGEVIAEAVAGVGDAAERAALDRWLAVNRRSVEGVAAGVLDGQDLLERDVPWGETTYRPGEAGRDSEMYLHVFDWHATGELVVYGLRTEPARAWLLADPAREALPVRVTERGVVVAGPKEPPDAIDSVVVLEFTGNVEASPVKAAQSADGSVTLQARRAVVQGRTARYEPEPHKDTIGYWTDASDRVSWHFTLDKPGTFAVTILQGCGAGSGGSEVEFAVGRQVLRTTVQDTGGFQNFVERDIGRVELRDAGRLYTLTVTPRTKPGVAVMDLRRVMLKPVE